MTTRANSWNRLLRGARPGLLVSVRNAAEALAALAGGADVIDVKEPSRGPLGRADSTTIAAVVRAIDSRARVTAALGELVEMNIAEASVLPAGVSLFKVGLAGCGTLSDWRARLQNVLSSVTGHATSAARLVAVAYADWPAADAPHPNEVLHAAVQLGCPVLLVDTWDKRGGSLFTHWPADELAAFMQSVRSHQLSVVLAGSLMNDEIIAAARLRPDLVAVRAAACDGGRRGTVSAERVHRLRCAVASAVEPRVPEQLQLFS